MLSRCNQVVLTLVLTLSVAQPVCAVVIPLTNPSFEDPVGAKTVGDATWSNIPGWTSTGPSSDSGIEEFNAAPQPDLGANIAFLQSGDGAIYQTTGYTIQSGDSFGLSFYERNDFEAEELTIRFYYDDGTRNVYDTQVISFSGGVPREGPLPLQTVTSAATGVAVGSLLGIEFENTSPGGSGEWGWIDNISLQTVGGPGDVNNDGAVDTIDYGIIRDNFRTNVGDRTLGDLNLDGTVDFIDFIEWRENASPAALAALGISVPEPAAGLMLTLAPALAVRRRSSRR